MKKLTILVLAITTLLAAKLSYAVQITARDISNTVVSSTCGAVSLATFLGRSDLCIGFPSGSLELTVTADSDGEISSISEIHVVAITNNSDVYSYRAGTSWVATSLDNVVSSVAQPAFVRGPWEASSRSVIRYIYLRSAGDASLLLPGTEVWVGVRSGPGDSFQPQNVSKVFVVPSAPAK